MRGEGEPPQREGYGVSAGVGRGGELGAWGGECCGYGSIHIPALKKGEREGRVTPRGRGGVSCLNV